MLMPYTLAPVAAAVTAITPVPLVAPMVLAVTVPMFTAPVAVEGMLMAVQVAARAAASPHVKS